MRVRTSIAIAVSMAFLLFASITHAAGPIHHWSKVFGDNDGQFSGAVAVDASGNVYITGSGFGTVDFGGGPLTGSGGTDTDILLAKFSPSGAHIWSKRFGDAAEQTGFAIAVSPAGDVVITGYIEGSADLGGGVLTANDIDVFAAKFDGSGTHLWSRIFGSAGDSNGYAISLDLSGNTLVAGITYNDNVDFGGGPLGVDSKDGIVAKLDTNGNHMWSKRITNTTAVGKLQEVAGISSDGSTGVYLTGHFEGTVDFGSGPVTPIGYLDLYVLKYDASGALVWLQTFGDAVSVMDPYGDVGVDAAGNLTFLCQFQGNPDFGAGPASGQNVLLSLDSTGAYRWSRTYVGCTLYGTSANAAGEVAITGQLWGAENFGGSTLVSASGEDPVVAKYNGNGVHKWSARFDGTAYGWDTALNASGDVFATGDAYNTPVDFGGGGLTVQGNDIFLAKWGEEEPIATLFTHFDATPTARGVRVSWQFHSDDALAGFTLYRRDGARASVREIASGALTSLSQTYLDTSVEPGKSYRYHLVVKLADGADVQSPLASVVVPALGVSLGQNHPNPFRPTTRIEYTVHEQAPVVIGVYDASGALVARLNDGTRAPGTYGVVWNGRDTNGRSVSSGVYFYRLEGSLDAGARKMVLLK